MMKASTVRNGSPPSVVALTGYGYDVDVDGLLMLTPSGGRSMETIAKRQKPT